MSIRVPICALLTALLAGCATHDPIAASRYHLQHGNILLAYREVETARAAELAAGRPVGDELETTYQQLHLRYLIQSGREQIYANQEEEALVTLAEVLSAQPDNEAAKELSTRAHHKLAQRATLLGYDHLAKGELDKALLAFDEAQRHEPQFKRAVEGVAAVHASVQKLHEESQKQFLEAIRKLPELRFAEVSWHASAALQRDSKRSDADEVRVRAAKALAEAEKRRAEKSQQKSAYGAALLGYRTAQRLWPEMPGVAENIALMEREVLAQWKTEHAAMAIRADKLDEASKLLKEAFELSTLERGAINELLFEARKRTAMHVYDKARDLELQGMKAEALAAFEELSKDWKDGLVDEKTRIGALRSDIQGAEKAFAEGEAAEQKNDLKQALEHYRAAETYYAGYKDTAARIARLIAAIASSASK